MIVYRLSKGKFARDLSGKGAELYGGRWNSKGVAMVYTSQSRALAFSEVAMHIPLGIVPKDYFLITIELPDNVPLFEWPHSALPTDWRTNPHSDSTQKIGDAFIREGQHLVLRVPSAVVPGDFNFLVNPAHPQMSRVTVVSAEPFEFDSRFATRGQ
jgi:RES domain-containing protein